MAALKFWKWTDPDGELGIDSSGGAFIVWNPDTGEAQFFQYGHNCFDDNWEKAYIEPFDGYQMAVVNKRYAAYLLAHGKTQGEGVQTFDRSAHEDFLRGL